MIGRGRSQETTAAPSVAMWVDGGQGEEEGRKLVSSTRKRMLGRSSTG